MRLARSIPLAVLLATVACSPDRIGGPNAAITAAVREPIIFVHGYNSSGAIWQTMADRFRADGYTDAELVAWSYDWAQSNATTAKQLGTRIDELLAATGASKVDIVTHSMGGLSARYFVKSVRGGAKKVDGWVSLAGPNHGTNTALFCGTQSCVEMRPGSNFLSKLNSKDETPGAPRYATWWSSCDQVILPQTSTPLSGAANTQTACLQHSQLYTDAIVYAQVRDWVRGGGTTLASR
jgi:triacylglycerol lipase